MMSKLNRKLPEGVEVRNSDMQVSNLRVEEYEGNGTPTIVGYAAVYNSMSEDLGGFREEIAPGAFTRALSEQHDVRALVDHDASKIIGRSTAGTLRMQEDHHGLRVEIDTADTTAGRDIMESLSRGDVTGMSFGFTVKSDEWRTLDGEDIRTLRDLDLFDVSVVSYPAYSASSAEVALRSLGQHKADMDAEVEAIRLDGATADARARVKIAEMDDLKDS